MRHIATGDVAQSSNRNRGPIRLATQPVAPQTIHHAKSGGSTSNDEHSSSAARALNPCSLVSVSQAQSVAGSAISGLLEAPLGPTCIYKVSGPSGDITLAVESMSFSQVTKQLTKPAAVTVGGHAGYCGLLGREMLFVSLPGGRVLNVTAPCTVAQRFAAFAISRLTA